MMNDMMPAIEETLTLDIEAQLEHEQWLRGEESREQWAAIEQQHGPLLTRSEWEVHSFDYSEYLDMGWKD